MNAIGPFDAGYRQLFLPIAVIRHAITVSGSRLLRILLHTILCASALIGIAGCSGMSDFVKDNSATRMITGASEIERRQQVLLSDRMVLRAREYEKDGEIYEALLCWQILGILNPADRDYTDRYHRLRLKSQQLANRHFESGVLLFKKRAYQSARQEFIRALRYNPDHAEALEYLKNKMTFEIIQHYQIQPEDSLAGIAKTFYQDPNKYYLIAVYNNLDLKQKLSAGNYLKLPVLEPGLTKPTVDITGELARARKLFLNQDYQEALRRTNRILKLDPSNGGAEELKNAALYQIAERFRKQDNYVESLKTLKKLDPQTKGVRKDIAEVKKLLEKQAEENYRLGVNYFVNERFNQAIESWQLTLIQNPQHPKARQDIEKARRLLNKLEEMD